jgi:hypothetical protein
VPVFGARSFRRRGRRAAQVRERSIVQMDLGDFRSRIMGESSLCA